MTSRFITNLIVLIAGAFLTVVSLVLGLPTIGWLGLGVGGVALVSVLAGFPARGRGLPQRVVDVLIATLATWTVIASRTFSGTPLRWLSFAEGVGLVTLAVIGLIAHEILLELSVRRVVSYEHDGHIHASIGEPVVIK